MVDLMKTKEFLTIDDLISQIRSKGIIIDNEDDVKKILEFNNYYYIMGYKSPFKDNDGNYKPDTNYNDIYNLYLFDKELKILFLDPLLEIEQKLKFFVFGQHQLSEIGLPQGNTAVPGGLRRVQVGNEPSGEEKPGQSGCERAV